MESDAERAGAPIPGAEHAEPAPPNGDGPKDDAPDFTVRPESPPEEPKPQREPPKPKPLRINDLQSQLHDVFAGIALMVATTGDTHCANIIATQAEPLSEAWTELAKKNARVKAMLEMMLQGSAWGQVVMVTAATVIPIAAHHGIYPKGFPMPFTFGLGPAPQPSDEVKEAEQRNQPGQ